MTGRISFAVALAVLGTASAAAAGGSTGRAAGAVSPAEGSLRRLAPRVNVSRTRTPAAKPISRSNYSVGRSSSTYGLNRSTTTRRKTNARPSYGSYSLKKPGSTSKNRGRKVQIKPRSAIRKSSGSSTWSSGSSGSSWSWKKKQAASKSSGKSGRSWPRWKKQNRKK